MTYITDLVARFSGWIWGTPLLILLFGGGAFFLFYSRFTPLLYLRHAIDVLRGKYSEEGKAGQISHYEALSTAIAATVGMGNIAGVAVAITMGGPGAIFWMWVSAFFGILTKFFTCTLAVMYRGTDSRGDVRGGPMYVIEKGLGKNWRPLAVFFAVVGLVGSLPAFTVNQLTASLNLIAGPALGYDTTAAFAFAGGEIVWSSLITGLLLAALTSTVIFGGIQRISRVAARLVPAMVVLYFGLVMYILFQNAGAIPGILGTILEQAFQANALLGGGIGAVIIIGARRAAFSNEAGIGTAPMVHGDSQTDEPVREGLVAMLGPIIDTLVVCTLTALVILSTGVYEEYLGTDGSGMLGVTLTLDAFNQAIPGAGGYLLGLCILIFAVSSLLTYSYYGVKCLSYLVGAQRGELYNYVYILFIVVSSVASLGFVVNLIDSGFALMAMPTMLSAILLAPKVRQAANDYFRRLREGKMR